MLPKPISQDQITGSTCSDIDRFPVVGWTLTTWYIDKFAHQSKRLGLFPLILHRVVCLTTADDVIPVDQGKRDLSAMSIKHNKSELYAPSERVPNQFIGSTEGSQILRF
jgi:hypothetical protein